MKPTTHSSTSLSLATLLLACALINSHAAHAAPDGWFFGRSSANAAAAAAATTNSNQQLERDASLLYQSPSVIGRLQTSRAARAFALSGGRLPINERELQQMRELDLFQCVDERTLPFDTFTRQYNRSYLDESERIERWQLFHLTLKRAIMLNRIVQNEILNATNYHVKPEIRNYHFIEPISGASNAALWYADLTDCELGLINYVMFELIHRVETNDLAYAYKLLDENRAYLPTLFNDEGFEQLANILLVRLYDRFRGDESMNRLFEWPVYLKRLAAYMYSQSQVQQAQHKQRMALISFAYPAYFKDVRYNQGAINRTGDNLRANEEHKRFNGQRERKFANLSERNKRLAIFRQRWTLLSHLNDEQLLNDSNVRLVPEWQRLQYLDPSSHPAYERSGKLLSTASDDAGAHSNRVLRAYRMTQFSDLTDVEFVAFLSNDFSLLEHNKESQDFLDRNFRSIRPLDSEYRWELAAELELRRASSLPAPETALESSGGAPDAGRTPARATLRLAKQVIDELISDVGLPIGPASYDQVSEEEHFRVFERLGRHYAKSYATSAGDQAEERQRRYEVFKQNYGRFLAWWTKEGWQLDEEQQVTMLRLADLSWLEVKLTLFKICCLNGDNLIALSALNSTLNYLGSHSQLMCSQMGDARGVRSGRLQQQQQPEASSGSLQELNALELYYYYCVHFNKHSLSRFDFERRLEVFKRNVESLRRHSCRRSLTLYESLRLKKPDILNTIDVIDPRRSHTDDLNLDRFEYFRLPNSNSLVSDSQSDLNRLAYETADDATANKQLDSSRAAISYRREPFAPLLTSGNRRTIGQTNSNQQQQQQYIERLVNESEDQNEFARKYARNNVRRVYDLVVARYKLCMKSIQGVDLDDRELRQTCQPKGPLSDQAGTNYPFEAPASRNSRLRAPNGQQRTSCQYYWEGLEPWAANLIGQDGISGRLIREAKCAVAT